VRRPASQEIILLVTPLLKGSLPWYAVLFDKKSIEPFQLYVWERSLPSFPKQENSWNGYEA